MFCTIRKFFKQPTQPVYLVNICAVKISACKQFKRIDPNLFYVSTKEILEVNAALGQHRFRNAVPHGFQTPFTKWRRGDSEKALGCVCVEGLLRLAPSGLG